MKVYIVCQYNYNEYYPRAMFDTLEAAKEWRKNYIGKKFTERQFPISEHELNGPIEKLWEDVSLT